MFYLKCCYNQSSLFCKVVNKIQVYFHYNTTKVVFLNTKTNYVF
jgi:hypothetical protein